jgi:adenosylcobinamide kinase/adenosylcobinamide-phosphate guanylyltransferase
VAKEHDKNVLYVATALAFDEEMTDRIANHRAARPDHWQTLETPRHPSQSIPDFEYDTLLLDCITLMAANILLEMPEDTLQTAVTQAVEQEVNALLKVYKQQTGTWIVVSNEVGMGVVPPTRLGRFYRDALGRANQLIAQTADEVILMVAGLPWYMKK